MDNDPTQVKDADSAEKCCSKHRNRCTLMQSPVYREKEMPTGFLIANRLCAAAALAMAIASPSGAQVQMSDSIQLEVELAHTFRTDPEVDRNVALGSSVSVRNGMALVGAPGLDGDRISVGAAFLYDLETGEMIRSYQVPSLFTSNEFATYAVGLTDDYAIVTDPTNIVNGDFLEERTFVFDLDSGELLREIAHPEFTSGNTQFGQFFDVSGNRAVIGGSIVANPGLYNLDTGELENVLDPGPDWRSIDERFTAISDIVFNGERVVMTGGNSLSDLRPQVAVFDANTGLLERRFAIDDPAAFDESIRSVAIEGNLLALGVPGADIPGLPGGGAVYLYDLTTGEELDRLYSSDLATSDNFGSQVDIDDGLLLVAANLDIPGNAYLFDVHTGEELAILHPPDIGFGDFFGDAISLDGEWAVLGAPEYSALGFPGRLGSAYAYRITRVPEPTTAVMLLGAGLCAGRSGHRRRLRTR